MSYNDIFDFCKVRNTGTFRRNSTEVPTNRLLWIQQKVRSLNLDCETDRWDHALFTGWNLYLKGSSDIWLTAHHDIVNPNSDNAQDNSASIINLIQLKLIAPWVNIAILDGEEVGGLGAARLCEHFESGWPVRWILNLELTGRGGTEFLVGGPTDSPLMNLILDTHPHGELHNTPFNDSVIFRQHGFDSVVINPLPRVDGILDTSEFNVCHSLKDRADRVSLKEMQQFVESILLPIVQV